MSTLKVNKIEPSTGTAIQIGTDGTDTVVTVTGDLHVDGDTVYNNVTIQIRHRVFYVGSNFMRNDSSFSASKRKQRTKA